MESGDDFPSSGYSGEKSAFPPFLERSGRRRTQGYSDLFRSNRVRRRQIEIRSILIGTDRRAARSSNAARPAVAPYRLDMASKNFVRFFQRFLAPDINPFAFDLKRFHRLARIKPLHKTSGLIRTISRRQIGRDKR